MSKGFSEETLVASSVFRVSLVSVSVIITLSSPSSYTTSFSVVVVPQDVMIKNSTIVKLVSINNKLCFIISVVHHYIHYFPSVTYCCSQSREPPYPIDALLC